MERIDNAGINSSNSITLAVQDVVDMPGFSSFTNATGWADGTYNLAAGGADPKPRHQLVIDGDSSTVVRSRGWGASLGTVTNSGKTYAVYNQGNAQLLVASPVSVLDPGGATIKTAKTSATVPCLVVQNGSLTAYAESLLTLANPRSISGTVVGTKLVNGWGGQSGFGLAVLSAADDASISFDLTPIFGRGQNNPFTKLASATFVNNNGIVSFGTNVWQWDDQPFSYANIPVIAPFWADVDTRGTIPATQLTLSGPIGSGLDALIYPLRDGGNSAGANSIWAAVNTVHGVFTVTWDDVATYAQQTTYFNFF